MRQLTSDEIQQIENARDNKVLTSRITSPGAEEVLHKPFHVLDHGMIRLVDYMGDDRAIPQAARISYGQGTKTVRGDEGLIRYLMRHMHTTPFEMVQAKFHVVLPVFSARQWMRHRAGTYNEMSARYSVLDREFYIPDASMLSPQSKTNKQGRDIEVLGPEESARVLDILKGDAARNYDHYLEMINDEEDPGRVGLTRELARTNLPVSIYTQFYWSVNLHNLFHFLRLRADAHAQYEIRVYAQTIIDQIVKPWCPISTKAFEDYSMNAVRFSAGAADMIAAALSGGKTIDPAEFNLGKSEVKELVASFPAIAPYLAAA